MEKLRGPGSFKLTPDTLGLLLCLVAPLVVHTVRIASYLFDGNLPFDTTHTYFPLAQSFLRSPREFFSNPDSLMVPPGTYVYMALSGVDAATLKSANLALSITVLCMLFASANRLSGRVAAGAAAWLYACSPTLSPLAVTPQSEPLFLFLVALWFWACVMACAQTTDVAQSGWIRARGWLLAALGGLALAAATLTRATYMYWIPVAAMVCLGLCVWGAPSKLACARKLLLVHLLALTGVGAYIAHNQIAFKKPVVSTGTGIALYLGSNAITSGHEPPYHGLAYDDILVTDNLRHISLEGDRRLLNAARLMLRDTPIHVLAAMYWEKLGAVVFFSKARLERHVLNTRAWRMLLLVLAAYGIWNYRNRLPLWMIAGALVYQTLVHVPVLYNPRYSIGALDIILTLLAALGVGALSRRKSPVRAFLACAGALLVCISLGAYHQRHSSPVMPDLSKGPHSLVSRAAIDDIQITGMHANPFTALADVTMSRPSIRWNGVSLEPAGLVIAKLGVASWDMRCRSVTYSYQTSDGFRREFNLRLEGLSEHQDIAFGTLDLIDREHTKNGALSLTFDCPLGSKLQFNELAIYNASTGQYYGAQIRDW